jgi:hypothetical protein
LEEYVDYILRVEKQTKKEETSLKQAASKQAKLVSCLVYSSALKKEVTYSSETLGGFLRTACHYVAEYRAFDNHHCENLKSYYMLNCR